ncbi:MAG: hypothetical protein AAF432_15345 [Planctomycetota bacterium]
MKLVTNSLYGATLAFLIGGGVLGVAVNKPWFPANQDRQANADRETIVDTIDRVEDLLAETELKRPALDRAPGIDMQVFSPTGPVNGNSGPLRWQNMLHDARRINHARLGPETSGSVTNITSPRRRQAIQTTSSTGVRASNSASRGKSIFERSRRYGEVGSTYRTRSGKPSRGGVRRIELQPRR